MNNNISQNYPFSEEVLDAIYLAEKYAKESLNENVNPAHLLKAILHKEIGLVDFLKNINKDYYYLLDWANIRIGLLPKSTKPTSSVSLSTGIIAVLNEANNYRLTQNAEKLDPFFILASLATPGVGFSFEQLKSLNISCEEVIAAIQPKLNNINKTDKAKLARIQPGKNLSKYTKLRNNTFIVSDSPIIIGFENELQSIFQSLGKKSKPNILIIGESGVGKTSLIEIFTQRITKKDVPFSLADALVYELDITSILSEVSYKGEIEDRMKKILKELTEQQNPILIIEGIDKIFDKQNVLYGLSSLLKKELDQTSFKMIATTSIECFTKNIETDKEFISKTEILMLQEPSKDASLRIIKGVKKTYEDHHGLEVPDEVIGEAIQLAKRFMGNINLPASALDLIDKTLSYVHIMNDISERDINILKEKLESIRISETETEGIESAFDLMWLHREIYSSISALLLSKLDEKIDFTSLTDNNKKIEYLYSILSKLEMLAKNKKLKIDEADLSIIIARQTGIPIGKIQTKERDRLINAEDILKCRVVGQDHAIKTILDAIYESRSGLNKKGQPIASIFLSGPTGTGKTELTKAIAEFLFQDETAIIRFDMSEYMESHSVATMTGAPAGYIGYEEGGLLVNKIRQKPYSIVLFDEIEKAHPDVFNIFLQLMDEGKIHDKLNRIGDFSNALIIFTSNVGSDYIFKSFESGEIPSSNDLKQIMINHNFKPEFLGRLTEIIPFSPITEKTVRTIFDIQLKQLLNTLSDLQIELIIPEQTRTALALSEFSPQLGARPILGIIRNRIRRPLSKMIVSGKIECGSKITLTEEKGELIWNY